MQGISDERCRSRKPGLLQIIAALFSLLAAGLAFPLFLMAEDDPCLMCHEPLLKEKVVHQALAMGCASCHSALDTNDIPHKVTGKIAKGLTAEQPDLCYTCHDASKFAQKVVHAALGMGCTVCHNPHSSKNAKLLVNGTPELCFGCHESRKFQGGHTHGPVAVGGCLSCHTPHSGPTEKLLVSATPDLCYMCHDKAEFSRQNVHMPVAGGMCLSCHVPHASEEKFLIPKSVNEVCRGCHAAQSSGRHVLSGFRGGGHPVAGKPDPGNPGKTMTCLSCHLPHSSDVARLLVQRGVCRRCHKY